MKYRFLLLPVLFFFALVASACQGISSSETLTDATALRILVSQEGIYHVSLSEIGWGNVDPQQIRLTHRQNIVPVWLETGENDTILYFYGWPSESRYTNQNVYLLQISEQASPPIEALDIQTSQANPLTSVTATTRIEENICYTPLAKESDHWFWQKFVAPQSQTYKVDLADVLPGPGKIRVGLWGNTMAEVEPDHQVQILVNDQEVASQTWDGQAYFTLSVDLPENILQPGSNQITIEATGGTEAMIDIFYLDWIELDYLHPAEAEDGRLSFMATGSDLRMTGFRGPLTLWDISNPLEVSRQILPEGTDTFLGLNDHRYLVVDAQGYIHPDQILPAQMEPDLRASEMGADYLAIGSSDLLEALSPLLEWRSKQGLAVSSIPIQAIYDQFNSGMPEPEAIREFLKYTHDQWSPAPRFVLLVGDSSYDFRGFQNPVDDNFLPVLLVETVYGGETASDPALTQINEDPWPDIAIGRVPARTAEQVEVFVNKTLAYEQQGQDESWQDHILAIADGQEPIFQHAAQDFLDHFPANFAAQLLAPEAGASGTNLTIREKLESGFLISAYFGHGSVNMWGKDRLYTVEDADKLENTKLTVMLHLTCLTGLFTHPTEISLAESLLFNPKGGAVALLAPTSLTLPTDQSSLTDAFVDALSRQPNLTLGEISLYAWRQVPPYTTTSFDVMQTFHLLGDPALRLPLP
jgi:hypothetical protein